MAGKTHGQFRTFMIEKVIIHDDKIAVEFKSGLAIDVEA